MGGLACDSSRIAFSSAITSSCRVVSSRRNGRPGGAPRRYGLHRGLTHLGIENVVVRPQNWDELGKGVKTDKTDALALVQRLDRYVSGNKKAFAVVNVPTVEQEQARAISRHREQLREHRQRLEAQGRSLLLRASPGCALGSAPAVPRVSKGPSPNMGTLDCVEPWLNSVGGWCGFSPTTRRPSDGGKRFEIRWRLGRLKRKRLWHWVVGWPSICGASMPDAPLRRP